MAGQSLVKNYIHIIFSTKHRQKFITEPVEDEMYRYVGGICNRLECPPLKIGGYDDHMHILCVLSKKMALMKLLEEIKSHSSKWMKTLDNSLANFYWQNGYAAFSVNPTQVDRVIRYIANQRAHHNGLPFQHELREFLNRYGVEFDERYVWD